MKEKNRTKENKFVCCSVAALPHLTTVGHG